MTTEKYKRYAYMSVTFAGLFALLYLFFRYALRAILPFLAAFGTVLLVNPAASFFQKKFGGKQRIWRLCLSLLSLFILFFALFILLRALYVEATRFFSQLANPENLDAVFGFFCHPLGKTKEEGPLGELLLRLEDAIAAASQELLSRATVFVTNAAGEIPRILLFLPVVFLGSAYFAWDYEKIKEKAKEILPKKVYSALSAAYGNVEKVFFPYLFSYLKLMLLTFAFTALGLWILHVESPLFLALIIALLDLLPVIGVGTVLIPWGLYDVFFANRALGFGLLVLYLLHEVMRQFAEPKIVGRSLGVHPLLSLLFLYVGYSLFGILGLLLLPVFCILTKTFSSLRQKKEGK